MSFTFEDVPENFPNKGRYRVYGADWTPQGWADEPQYAGQLPLRFPLDWTPLECFLGHRIVRLDNLRSEGAR